jgi:hypothetical protein
MMEFEYDPLKPLNLGVTRLPQCAIDGRVDTVVVISAGCKINVDAVLANILLAFDEMPPMVDDSPLRKMSDSGHVIPLNSPREKENIFCTMNLARGIFENSKTAKFAFISGDEDEIASFDREMEDWEEAARIYSLCTESDRFKALKSTDLSKVVALFV